MAGYIASSNRVDWNTNIRDVGLVHEVLGIIHTDPCSNALSTVGAVVSYTEEDDGLAHRWHKIFFCNPPFGPKALRFVRHGWGEIDAGRCSEGIFFAPRSNRH